MDGSTFERRRRILRGKVENGAILLFSGEEAPRNYPDNTYPFRPDSHFLYYTGISRPGLALLITPDGEETLFAPPFDPGLLVWTGESPDPETMAEGAGIKNSGNMEKIGENVSTLAKKGERIHYLPPYRGSRVLRIMEILGVQAGEAMADWSRELARAVAAQRSIKGEEETSEIESALEITAKMYQKAFSLARPGIQEAKVAGAMIGLACSYQRAQAFNPIVSKRGEILHNTSYSNTIKDGDLLVIDSGAESPGFYASDITRTIPVSGGFTSRQREIYEIVLSAQEKAIENARPGVTNKELHLLASRVMAEGLKGLGFLKGGLDDIVEQGAHALFFPHGLGHMLGLDVHDMEDLGDIVGYEEGEERAKQFGLCYLRLARKLEPGFVITIEPGIYFIGPLIESWERQGKFREFINYELAREYVGFGGIRIEDDVLITNKGARVLGPSIPKTPDDIEKEMSRR